MKRNGGYVYLAIRKSSCWLWKPRYQKNISQHGWGFWWLGFFIGGGS